MFSLEAINSMFMDAFAEVEMRRRWEEENMPQERELTPYERMLKAGFFNNKE